MTVEKKVLVPLDFSAKTFHVLQFVLRNAGTFNWSVFVLLSFDNERLDENENIDQAFERLLTQFRSEFPLVKISGEAIRGDLLQMLLEVNTNEHFDLIVSAQYTDVLQYTTRNLMEGLVEQCYTPVLVLPENSDLPDLQRIGVMTSFHEDEIESIKLVEQLFNGKLFVTIFHILEENENERSLERMREWELVVKGNIENSKVGFLVVESESVIEGVRRVIMGERIDLLVVTSISKTFIQKLLSRDLFKELTQTRVMQPTLFIRCV
ncbi:universal stress protein [Olivibacter sp. XZL3]|uniref:universal stress protein n=1 Tax=Olivibacter sp. XZL3 TaxID=1735116 RepID=UPI00106663D1|nr:universal stress protein [Olivibacter sp. XZL3]